MKKFKRWIICLVLTAMFSTSAGDANAREYYTDAGGYAYESCYQSSCIAPAIVLALVAIAGIIAVGVQNRSKSSHAHVHGDSD